MMGRMLSYLSYHPRSQTHAFSSSKSHLLMSQCLFLSGW